jgi:hypothetical protein
VAANLPGQRWPELLYTAQDGPAADVDAAVGENASDAFGGGTKL